jgi:hypothetical protein
VISFYVSMYVKFLVWFDVTLSTKGRNELFVLIATNNKNLDSLRLEAFEEKDDEMMRN